MKSRILDHIDLRVKDLQRAMKFYGKLLPALGFNCDRSDETWGTFYSVGGDKASEFFGFTEDQNHHPLQNFQRGVALSVGFFAPLFKQSTGLARSDFRLGGRSTFTRPQQNDHFSAQQIAGHTGRGRVARYWNPGALLLRCAFYRRDWRLHAKTLGRVFDDLRHRRVDPAGNETRLAPLDFPPGDFRSNTAAARQLFYCLVPLSRPPA